MYAGEQLNARRSSSTIAFDSLTDVTQVKSARERSLLIPSVVMGSYGLYDFNMGAKEHVELASGAGVDSAMEEMLKGRGQTEIVHSYVNDSSWRGEGKRNRLMRARLHFSCFYSVHLDR